MNQPAAPASPSRGSDLIFVLLGVLSLIGIHYRAAVRDTGDTDSGPLVYALMIPLLYVFAATLFARTEVASAGRRSYVLSCLGGLCGVGYVAMAAIDSLSLGMLSEGDAATIDLAASTGLVLGLMRDTAIHFLLPIINGIAIYTVCSVFESSESGFTISQLPEPAVTMSQPVDFGRLADWLEASDAPEAVKLFLHQMGQQVADLTTAYQGLAESTRQAGEEIGSSAAAAKQWQATIAEVATSGTQFANDVRQASEGLVEFREELAQLNQAGTRLTETVDQIRLVVDELGDLASHEILNMGSARSEVGQ